METCQQVAETSLTSFDWPSMNNFIIIKNDGKRLWHIALTRKHEYIQIDIKMDKLQFDDIFKVLLLKIPINYIREMVVLQWRDLADSPLVKWSERASPRMGWIDWASPDGMQWEELSVTSVTVLPRRQTWKKSWNGQKKTNWGIFYSSCLIVCNLQKSRGHEIQRLSKCFRLKEPQERWHLNTTCGLGSPAIKDIIGTSGRIQWGLRIRWQ